MITWIASYPKSGNTWVRALLSSYFFSNKGYFEFDLLKNIKQFPIKEHFEKFSSNFNNPVETTNYWLAAQDKINLNKKMNFLKTHNAMCNINGNIFTNKKNTAGCLYIVRDPRNVVLSIAHHYELTLSEAFEFITNKRKIIFNSKNKNDFGDVQFLGDWSSHYRSWKETKNFPIKIIKYEDLAKDTLAVFFSILNFLGNITHVALDQKKIKIILKTTNFEVLKKKEKKYGFEESIVSKQKNEKIQFFNLGKENNWTNMLDTKIEKKIRETFGEEMKELKYI